MPPVLEQGWIALVAVAILVISGAVYLPWSWFQRSKAIAAAGNLYVRVVRPRVRRWHRVDVLFWTCIGITLAVLFFLGSDVRGLLLPGFFLLFYIVVEAYRRLFDVDPMAVEIRENGLILRGIQFWPWDRIQTYRWKDGRIPTLVLQYAKYGFVNFGVAPEQKDMIEGLLSPHVRSATNATPPQGAASPGPPPVAT